MVGRYDDKPDDIAFALDFAEEMTEEEGGRFELAEELPEGLPDDVP